MQKNEMGEQLSLFARDLESGKTYPDVLAAERRPARTSASSLRNSSELWMGIWLYLDLHPGGGNLLGTSWEPGFPSLFGCWMPASGPSPRDAAESTLSSILEATPHPKYYLTPTACLGILRRAERRGKELPPMLEQALRMQAAIPAEVMASWRAAASSDIESDSGECLTPWDCQSKRIYPEDGTWPSLYAGEGGGRGYVSTAFACNQRDEVRDLHDVAGALCSTQTMKQQTFVTQLEYCATVALKAVAGFSPNPSANARGIGYEQECSPTITTNTPAVICLNDQGGQRMDVLDDMTGTLRAQMSGHPPLVMATQQGGAEICEDLCPTITASAGTSGNNQPVILPEAYAISGTAIDRQPLGGGNGLGIQREIAPSLTTCDRPAVCTVPEIPAQYQEVIGALCRGDEKGIGSQYVSQDKCVFGIRNLVRRLTPLECERLQGFPDGWTEMGSDSARYKALGNSVAVPCVEFVMMGIAAVYAGELEGDSV